MGCVKMEMGCKRCEVAAGGDGCKRCEAVLDGQLLGLHASPTRHPYAAELPLRMTSSLYVRHSSS